ncbi:putative motility protein [Devosia sp. A8/3-2]|nr:putative motility protein [Devosia sp. A8/3-2]
MDSDLATQMVTMRTAVTQNSVQMAVLKKTHDSEATLLNTLLQSAPAAPPPGRGLKIDKQA